MLTLMHGIPWAWIKACSILAYPAHTERRLSSMLKLKCFWKKSRNTRHNRNICFLQPTYRAKRLFHTRFAPWTISSERALDLFGCLFIEIVVKIAGKIVGRVALAALAAKVSARVDPIALFLPDCFPERVRSETYILRHHPVLYRCCARYNPNMYHTFHCLYKQQNLQVL